MALLQFETAGHVTTLTLDRPKPCRSFQHGTLNAAAIKTQWRETR